MSILSNILLSILLLIPVFSFAADAIDINTADKATLMTVIKGVGEKRAEAIIAYREKNGPFKHMH